jgi:hypothetical protein
MCPAEGDPNQHDAEEEDRTMDAGPAHCQNKLGPGSACTSPRLEQHS